MKENIKVTEFEDGKIVERNDARYNDIYIYNLSNGALAFMREFMHKLPAEKFFSYMVHWGDRTESLIFFGEEVMPFYFA